MGLCKIYLIVGYLMVSTHCLPTLKDEIDGQHIEYDVQEIPRADVKMRIVDTNMSIKNQKGAQDLLQQIIDSHADKNHCKEYALGFAEQNRNTRWGCFRFSANDQGEVLEGSYYVQSSTYLEVAATIENEGKKEITHYFLFDVRKW